MANVRVAFDDDGLLEQKLNYYPYGALWEISNNTSDYDWKSGTVEREDAFGLAYERHPFRTRDPIANVWLGVDPMSGAMPFWGGYNSMGNNPVSMTDHLGLSPSTSIDGSDVAAEKSNDRENRKADREKEKPKPHGDGWIGQSYGSNYHTWTRGNDQIMQMWDGEKWLQQYRNLDQTGTGYGLSSSPFALTSTYADPIIDFMEFMFLTVSPLPIINVGGFKSIGAFKLAKISKASKEALTTAQLVQKSASLAERAIGGTGRFAGTSKHTYANNLLSRYQSIYGDRGLQFNYYFNNGVGNRGFLDVINQSSQTIYDFKFGNATWRSGQLQKYQRNFPGFSIQQIRP